MQRYGLKEDSLQPQSQGKYVLYEDVEELRDVLLKMIDRSLCNYGAYTMREFKAIIQQELG